MDHKSLMMGCALLALLAGCGGDSGGYSAGASYPFVTPTLNSVATYAEVITDNEANTINVGYQDSVTAVGGDGTYAELEQDPSHQNIVVNGTNYSITTEHIDFDDTGHELSYTYTDSAGSEVSCTEAPHGAGPNFPLLVGASWSLDYSVTCSGGAAIAYTQSGQVVDVESVTVAAGTFNAIKLQSTITWTNAQGTTRSETVSNWRDIATMRSVKQQQAITVSGTVPTTGYPVSRELELQSLTQ